MKSQLSWSQWLCGQYKTGIYQNDSPIEQGSRVGTGVMYVLLDYLSPMKIMQDWNALKIDRRLFTHKIAPPENRHSLTVSSGLMVERSSDARWSDEILMNEQPLTDRKDGGVSVAIRQVEDTKSSKDGYHRIFIWYSLYIGYGIL